MRIAGRLRKLVGTPLRRKLTREAMRFLASTAHCRRLQHQTLQRLIRLNAASEFGRRYRLHEVRTPEDLRARLPITNYDFYVDQIERLKGGQSEALLGPKNRLLMFSLTSGTTSASKYIPVTSQFLRDYRRGWQIWGVQALNDHPQALDRNIVQLNSDYRRFRTEAGIPCGNISGLVAALQKRIVRSMYAVPHQIVKITNSNAKYYAALRFAVADPDVGMIITANPGTLVRLATLADQFKEDLIRDIFDGTLSERQEISAEVREALTRRIRVRCRGRARQLEQIVERTGHLYPRDFWSPDTLIAVWTGGSCGAYLGQLRRYFGAMPIRDHGLSASEGRMTIPIRDMCPEGILEIGTHFFEFIPEAEYGRSDPTVLEAHELQEGQSYYILLTTSSGFYRYDICDVVQCTGFYQATPLLKFLHKGSHISSVTGEKLAESQVVEAVTVALDEIDLRVRQFTLAPVWGEPPGYRLLIEDQDAPSGAAVAKLEKVVDERLQEVNCEYREKRMTGRLVPVRVTLLRSGAWEALFQRRTERAGGSVEQYKHPCLLPDLKSAEELLRDFAADGAEMAAPATSAESVAGPSVPSLHD